MQTWNATLAPGFARLERGDWPAGLGETMAELVDEFAKSVVKADKRASKEAANRTGLSNLASVIGTRLRERMGEAAVLGDDRTIEASARAIEAVAEAEHRANRNVNLKFVCAGLVSDLGNAFEVRGQGRNRG